MEHLLSSAKELAGVVENNETAAGELLKQCETLQQQLKAMRQYRECLHELSGGVESRVRLPNIEFSYVRHLQQDNSELRCLLEEHQAALQMIMTKYRQQVSDFMANSKDVDNCEEDGQMAQDLACRTEQVYELAAVMYRAAQAEDTTSQEMSEKLARLEYENKHLREVLQLSCPVLSGDYQATDKQQQQPQEQDASSEQWPNIDRL